MRIFTTLSLMFVCATLSAQERTISGRLTSSEDGSPLPGISIVVKGTDNGTMTDINGNYTIKVPVGATLVFSFVGMKTREVIVTEDNLKPVKTNSRRENSRSPEKQPIPASLYKDSQHDTIGVAVLTDETPRYSTQDRADPSKLRQIKKRGNTYQLKTDSDISRRAGYSIQFSTSLAVERINKLPSLQNEYSQGRTDGTRLQWAGADQSEIFSWGPLLRTLEFDGSDYPYDTNGKLVTIGTGNGHAANVYDARSFFKTGFTNANEIMFALPARKNGTLLFDVENRTRSGVIPGSRYEKLNLGTSLKNIWIAEGLTMNATFSCNWSKGNLLNRGANFATIVGSVFRNPVTFDNTNGLPPDVARSSPTSYELANGSKRSHAPGIADNPYGLINDLPDNEKLQRWIGTLNLQYTPDNPFGLSFNGSIDKQSSTTVFGIAPGYSGYQTGRLTNRIDGQIFANSSLTGTYTHNHYDGELKISLSYRVDHTLRNLDREDGFDFNKGTYGDLSSAGSTTLLQKDMARTAQELALNAQYRYNNWLLARLANKTYFSSTLNSKNFTNLFPTGSVSIDLQDALIIYVDELKLYATASRAIREAPLLYSNWSYASTNTSVENYSSFYEANELFFPNNIAPETERKFETGIRLQSGRVRAEINYFDNRTKNFIAPVTSEGYQLRNVAGVKNKGGFIDASYDGYMVNGSWGVELKWTKYNSTVDEILTPADHIALAGFQHAKTVLAVGQPTGAIYGTTYVRNEDGKKVIGADGFPLRDNELKMIGNPIPDWNIALSSYFQFKQFRISFLMDFKKGGDTWNGTNSVLDYLGRSSTTSQNRNISNFVFDGVDLNGVTNTTPVNFYDPSKSIDENKWVRYGWEGVGEDYIEDSSWLRLSELVFSYTLARPAGGTIKKIRVALIGRNLFLITPYSGVDPSSSLFGYPTANGLDLFNTPSLRSYSAQLSIQI